MKLRTIVLAAACSAFAFAANAAEMLAYDVNSFNAALKAGDPILVDVKASWCPTCKAQAPIVEKIAASPEYKTLKIYDVDFDTQKDALKKFGVRMQSTLIVFRNGVETGRSVGDTTDGGISALIAKTK
ncbi:MAG: thioredoxin family protein [Hyphomicrobiales bacterium]|nr:thioredoxin family protein [Hyphomicrobiales bacterium]